MKDKLLLKTHSTSRITAALTVALLLSLPACAWAGEQESAPVNALQAGAAGITELSGLSPELPVAGPSIVQSAARSLVAAGLIAYLSKPFEEPERMARLLDKSPLEGPVDAGNVYGSGFTLGTGALGMYLVGRVAGNQSLQSAGKDMGRSLVATGAAVWAMKLAFDRTRPDGGPYSFPSGHTAVAFSVVPAIRKHFGLKAAVPAFALAVSTGLGRMEERKHYLSDVIFGAAVGLTVGEIVVGSDPDSRLGAFVTLSPPRVGFSFGF